MKLDSLYPAVITLILIGLVLGIGIFVLSSIENNVDSSATGTVVGEALTQAELIAGTALDANGNRSCSASSVVIANGTAGGIVISSGNYTVTSCLIANTTASYSTSDWIVNYTYSYATDTEASTTVNQTIAGLGEFADWIAIIVVVIAAAIVLGIVLSSFGRRTPGV